MDTERAAGFFLDRDGRKLFVVRYEVRVAAGTLNVEPGRFELDRDEPLEEGDSFMQFDVAHEVQRVLPGDDEFDAIVEVEQVVGPGEVGPA